MAELGPATRALLAIERHQNDEPALAWQICRAGLEGLGLDGAGLSLLTATTARLTLAATDPTAQLLEDLQITLNEGACIDAAATGRPVLIPDLHHSSQTARWPVFAGAVAERTEVSALFAWPLQWGAITIGVLDLYRITPGPLDDLQWRDAAAFADTAALMLLGRRTEPAGLPGDGAGIDGTGIAGAEADLGAHTDSWLDEAIDYRVEIHQATGMVLAQLGISATDALARMRAHAFSHQQLLIDVARDVVHRRLVFTRDEP